MAPRKTKGPVKRNNQKMKTKANPRKREPKVAKKVEPGEKHLNSLKWLNKVVAEGGVKKCEALPDWFKNNGYKHKVSSETNVSEYEEYQLQGNDEEEKSATGSEISEECNCSNSKCNESNKGGILKMKSSSSSSLVAKYIKSGMNQVASFIVESAIRFGEQHGVVVPDKDTPNLYEVTPPDGKYTDKYRKIRFKVPKEPASYEGSSRDQSQDDLRDTSREPKKKNYNKTPPNAVKRAQTPMPEWTPPKRPAKSSSWESTPDSLEEILPILEKLKDGEEIVSSDLDLEKLRRVDGDVNSQAKDREWRRGRERERERDRERERSERDRTERDRTERDRTERERTERERTERVRSTDRGKEILRQQLRTLKKRYKSLGGESEKGSEDTGFLEDRNRWKKPRRDSVELGRQRLRAPTCPRKQENMTPLPY